MYYKFTKTDCLPMSSSFTVPKIQGFPASCVKQAPLKQSCSNRYQKAHKVVSQSLPTVTFLMAVLTLCLGTSSSEAVPAQKQLSSRHQHIQTFQFEIVTDNTTEKFQNSSQIFDQTYPISFSSPFNVSSKYYSVALAFQTIDYQFDSSSLSGVMAQVENMAISGFQIRAVATDPGMIQEWKVMALMVSNLFDEEFYVENIQVKNIDFDFSGSGSPEYTSDHTLSRIIENFDQQQLYKIYPVLRGITARTNQKSTFKDIRLGLSSIGSSAMSAQVDITGNFPEGQLTEVFLDLIIYNKTQINQNKKALFLQAWETSIDQTSYSNIPRTLSKTLSQGLLTPENTFVGVFSFDFKDGRMAYDFLLDSTDDTTLAYEVQSVKQMSFAAWVFLEYQCGQGLIEHSDDNLCYEDCKEDYFLETLTDGSQVCAMCSNTCLICQINSTNCQECAKNHYFLNSSTSVCTNTIPSGWFLDKSSNALQLCMKSCLTCDSSDTCLTCSQYRQINYTTNLCQAQPGYYLDTATQQVHPCMSNCLLCTTGTDCTLCIEGMSFDQKSKACKSSGSSVKAVCGDGIISSKGNEECDDGNVISGDGCSSQCKIESQFKCQNTSYNNNSDSQYSDCYYNGHIGMKQQSIIKNPEQNKVTFNMNVFPQLGFWKNINFSKILLLGIRGIPTSRKSTRLLASQSVEIQSIDYNPSKFLLSVLVEYTNVNLQSKVLQISLNETELVRNPQLRVNTSTFSAVTSTMQFTINPTNNLMANYFSTQAFAFKDMLSSWILAIAILTLTLGIAVFIMGVGKILYLELVLVFQVCYLTVMLFFEKGLGSISMVGLVPLKVVQFMFSNLNMQDTQVVGRLEQYGITGAYFSDMPFYYSIVAIVLVVCLCLTVKNYCSKQEQSEQQLQQQVQQAPHQRTIERPYEFEETYQNMNLNQASSNPIMIKNAFDEPEMGIGFKKRQNKKQSAIRDLHNPQSQSNYTAQFEETYKNMNLNQASSNPIMIKNALDEPEMGIGFKKRQNEKQSTIRDLHNPQSQSNYTAPLPTSVLIVRALLGEGVFTLLVLNLIPSLFEIVLSFYNPSYNITFSVIMLTLFIIYSVLFYIRRNTKNTIQGRTLQSLIREANTPSKNGLIDFGQFNQVFKPHRKHYYFIKLIQRVLYAGIGIGVGMYEGSRGIVGFLLCMITLVVVIVYTAKSNPYKFIFVFQRGRINRKIGYEQGSGSGTGIRSNFEEKVSEIYASLPNKKPKQTVTNQIKVRSNGQNEKSQRAGPESHLYYEDQIKQQLNEQQQDICTIFKHRTHSFVASLTLLILMSILLFLNTIDYSSSVPISSNWYMGTEEILLLIFCLLITLMFSYTLTFVIVEMVNKYFCVDDSLRQPNEQRKGLMNYENEQENADQEVQDIKIDRIDHLEYEGQKYQEEDDSQVIQMPRKTRPRVSKQEEDQNYEFQNEKSYQHHKTISQSFSLVQIEQQSDDDKITNIQTDGNNRNQVKNFKTSRNSTNMLSANDSIIEEGEYRKKKGKKKYQINMDDEDQDDMNQDYFGEMETQNDDGTNYMSFLEAPERVKVPSPDRKKKKRRRKPVKPAHKEEFPVPIETGSELIIRAERKKRLRTKGSDRETRSMKMITRPGSQEAEGEDYQQELNFKDTRSVGNQQRNQQQRLSQQHPQKQKNWREFRLQEGDGQSLPQDDPFYAVQPNSFKKNVAAQIKADQNRYYKDNAFKGSSKESDRASSNNGRVEMKKYPPQYQQRNNNTASQYSNNRNHILIDENMDDLDINKQQQKRINRFKQTRK